MLRTLFAHHAQASILQRRNPAVKLALVLGLMMMATFLTDFWTLTLLALLALVATWQLGRVPLLALLRALLPFMILGLGYLWMNALFPRANPADEVLFQVGPLRVMAAGVANGVVLTARALCFGACSLFFVTTTAPTDLARSLIHQCRLSPRLAYSLLAAYRLLPTLEGELAQIRAAHRLRGVGEGAGMAGKLQQVYRYTIPLLASAIRKADRVAVAMESRAFTGAWTRSYYRVPRVDRADWLLLGGALLALGVILLVCKGWGLLSL